MGKIIEGSWPENDVRRAFVSGASWWEFESRGATMWGSDRRKAEEAATARYGEGVLCPLEDGPDLRALLMEFVEWFNYQAWVDMRDGGQALSMDDYINKFLEERK